MVGLAIFLAFCLLLYLWLKQGSTEEQSNSPIPKEPSSGYRITATLKTYDPSQYKARNEERERWLKQRYPDADKWIFTKVAGVSHRNRSGSYRQRILRRCSAPEELRLVGEPDNPVDPNAIAVCRENGEQLGYLNRRLAADMHDWLAEGEHWSAVLTEVTGKDQLPTLGANIALVRMRVSEKQAAQQSPIRAGCRSKVSVGHIADEG
jgi:hypothetical protein